MIHCPQSESSAGSFLRGDAVRFPAKNASGRVYRGAGRKYCFMEEWAETIEISQREWYNIPCG